MNKKEEVARELLEAKKKTGASLNLLIRLCVKHSLQNVVNALTNKEA